jgi:5'-3' exonuclease
MKNSKDNYVDANSKAARFSYALQQVIKFANENGLDNSEVLSVVAAVLGRIMAGNSNTTIVSAFVVMKRIAIMAAQAERDGVSHIPPKDSMS